MGVYLENCSKIGSCAAETANVHTPATNTNAVVTYSAVSSQSHCISGVAFSYSGGTPTNANLKIEDGSGNTVFSVDVTSSGVGFIPFFPFLRGSVNTALIITLSAGGAGISGKLSVLNHWRE